MPTRRTRPRKKTHENASPAFKKVAKKRAALKRPSHQPPKEVGIYEYDILADGERLPAYTKIDCRLIRIVDDEGAVYTIQVDEGSLQVRALEGSLIIEPNVSNHITITQHQPF